MPRILTPALALSFVGLASPAIADELYVGSPVGTVLRADMGEGVFEFAGVCGGPIRSMVQREQTIMIGDANGNVYGLDLDDGGVGYYFTVPGSGNTAIVADGDTVLVSSLDGTIRRVSAGTGQLIATYNAQIEVRAMIRDEQFLYAAGPGGSIHRAPIGTGQFSYFACVCLGPINSLAIVGENIYAGDQFGTVLSFGLDDGIINGGFFVQGNNSAMAPTSDGHLLVSNADGQVRRIDLATAQVVETFTAPLEINSMVLVSGEPAPEPCPADFNDDGVVESADFFSFLSAFFASAVGSQPGNRADFNDDGVINSVDLFDFLTAFFTPCT